MQPKGFIKKVIDLYKNARKPAFRSPQIHRGRSRIVSGLTEDLFAKFLSKNLRGNFEFLVDQPLSLGKKTIYPDIVIINRKEKIVSLVDLKMDLGWKRKNFVHFCQERNDLMYKLKNSTVSYKNRLLQDRRNLKTSHRIFYQVVIVSSRNISKEKLSDNQAKIADLKKVKAYMLTENTHPNALSKNPDKKLSDIKINDSEFNRLLKDIIDVKG